MFLIIKTFIPNKSLILLLSLMLTW